VCSDQLIKIHAQTASRCFVPLRNRLNLAPSGAARMLCIPQSLVE
jgi:hypothetical protein